MLASSLIRRTFRSLTAPPNLCMNWRGVRSSALSPHDAGTHWRAHFVSFASGKCVFSDDFFQSLSVSMSRLSKCHESAPGADCLPYSAFKVSFLWWRHFLLSFLLSFFNLVLRFAVVPSAWKSSLIVPLDGDPASFALIVPFPSALVLAPCPRSHCTTHLTTVGRVARWFPLGRRHSHLQPCGLHLRHQVHTFVSFVDIKKAVDSCWV